MGYLSQPSEHSNMKPISLAKMDENEELCSYASWLEKHPSVLDNFEKVMSVAEGKEIVVFLDYDGTLSPIVDDPDKAYMSDVMRAAVREIAYCFPTAIVSGRCKDKVYEFVKLRNVYYAGSHGMDISTPSGSSKCEDQKHQIKGVDEKGNHVVHFHPAKEFLPTIQEVMEIRPNVNWDKGCALMYLLDTLGFDNFNNVLPIYLGDDRTDEDAFKVIRHIGQGFPIVVSSIAKETQASYSLRDPSDVLAFLIRLARWKKNMLHKTK
ncbi:probable trehalose-phosphate phosphatase D isoform X3 [Vigna unguiculata]|uniref:probable trehalose-phosphate phosphatase D isoform X3 n=1 Tax=Vigna unguiculata TaxID=3917 RepID=UPI001015E043|nr:probable trehalose-phosphate phosphatase D isoform X3 [Vigna unguiculata]